jgi:asparagine synthase (glutamine-hydrolysing)
MCGVAGFAGSLAAQPSDTVGAIIRAATSTLAHRGPDGDGFWCDGAAPVALGHRRLAIIDLSEAAAQPMASADGSRVITFNGEIYNYLALRQELESAGCTFRSGSDTEVLLTGCREWGVVETLRRARGMFAFAYVDVARREMWLCRDRFGEKPLVLVDLGRLARFAAS